MELSSHDTGKLSILYVEDDADARELLLSLLTSHYPQIDFVVAENGRHGLEIFRTTSPDIVVTDISMPIMDGITMAAEIKAQAPETIFIATTAYTETDYFLKAIEIGINHYVLKPVDYQKLFRVLDRSTETVRQGRQLRLQSEHIRKLSRVVEQSPVTVMITDREGRIEYVNPRFTALTGYSAEEVTGCRASILKSDNTPRAVFEDLWTTISSGRDWHGEMLNRKKNGELYWESAFISPIQNATGIVTHYVAIKEDVTQKKLADQTIEELNRELHLRARELEAANEGLEAFNYTVAHDLRSPLIAIRGFAQVLMDRCSAVLEERCRGHLEIICRESRRMDDLINSLLNFSRLSSQNLVCGPVSLSEIGMEVAEELLKRDAHRPAEFVIAPEMHCMGDPSLLRIVIENLLGNAWKYTSRIDGPRIEFGCSDPAAREFFIRDNGAGFDPAQADRLFEPFRRFHKDSEFEGTGIGLATVRRIIQRHGGAIRAEGEVGKGATFYFSIPGG